MAFPCQPNGSVVSLLGSVCCFFDLHLSGSQPGKVGASHSRVMHSVIHRNCGQKKRTGGHWESHQGLCMIRQQTKTACRPKV